MVQLLAWTGSRHYEDLEVTLSDGITWLKARLDPNYGHYLVGNMLLNYDIFKIMEYTGNAEDDSLNLVEIDRSRQFQMGGIKIGNPVSMTTVSSKITQTGGIKRLH